MGNNQIEKERNEIAEIISQNFDLNGEMRDASDFEWSAHCVQMAGYRKASDVAEEIFAKIDALIVHRMIADSALIDDRLITDIAELKKKYTKSEKDK